MKRLLFFILVFGPLGLFSQTISRQAVTSGGQEMENMGYTLSCSIGQFAVATYDPSGAILTQGFQQINYACAGDLNNDGVIDTQDLLLFLGQFGCVVNCVGDFNFDGVVNTQDLLLFLGYFGTSCLGP